MSSNNYHEKVTRSINQLQNTERLLSGMPKKVYLSKAKEIKEITRDIEKLIERIKNELANTH